MKPKDDHLISLVVETVHYCIRYICKRSRVGVLLGVEEQRRAWSIYMSEGI
jgi:hypothetical protein